MTQHTIHLQLTLSEPLVLSQSNATEGAHQSLDYIPGAAILGAIASQHYSSLKAQGKAYEIFHSGKVRFHNAYPLIAGEASYPVPFCLHYDKLGDKNAPLNYLRKTFNTTSPHQSPNEIQSVVQGKQHREGYIAPTETPQVWSHFKPEKTLQMRTAINPKKGKAQDSQLYGYQLLKSGTQYQAQISCDDKALAQMLEERLKAQSTLFIGRSRSAQYGKVQLSVETSETKTTPSAPIKPIIKIDGEDHLVLWLASDMAIYNPHGQPTLKPSLQDMGLEVTGELVAEKSFVRTRQYAPYNSFRRSYDLDRQVLTQGSILTYKLTDQLSDTDLQTLQQGIGAYTENGLGQVVLDKHFTLLEQDEVHLQTPKAHPQEQNVEEPKTALIAYLKEQALQREIDTTYAEKIDQLLEALQKLYQSIRNYNGLIPGQPFGPGKSQWGAIRNYATHAKDMAELHQKLFEGNDAFIKDTDQDWRATNGQTTFKGCLKKLVEDKNNDLPLIRGLAFKVTQNKTLLNLMEGKTNVTA